VGFVLRPAKVYIRPDNALSRALTSIWVKVLLWLFLIYPLIWLYKRFHSRGGGRWKGCGSAYALKYWRRVDDYGGATMYVPVGLKEEEWVEQNRASIAASVRNRLIEHD
jgi:hypothetical protein